MTSTKNMRMIQKEKNALNQDLRQVAFMPWAGIEIELCVGNYRVWPFAKFKESYVSDQLVREQLERIFSRYFERKRDEKSYVDVPVNSIVVISSKDEEVGIRQFSEDEQRDLLSISHSLAFTSIIDHFSAKASETFSLYIQNFKLGDNHITVFDTIYENLEMVKFMRPYSADHSQIPFTGSDLLNALGQALSNRNDSEIERLFRSLEFFFWAHTRSEFDSFHSKILSLATAFEIALGGYDKKLEFMDEIGKKLNKSVAPEPIMWDERPLWQKDRKTVLNKRRTVIEWWAHDFYDLRSEIIHGKKIEKERLFYKSGKSLFEIGTFLFERCIRQLLVNKSFLKVNPVINGILSIIMPTDIFKETNAQL